MGNAINKSHQRQAFQHLLDQIGFEESEKRKFIHLARYFKSIEISDLENIDMLEFEEAAEPDDKLIMGIFAQILKKKLRVLNAFSKDERKVLNFCRKLVSFHFSKLKPERISSKSLEDELKGFEDEKYDLIDMSNNNLLDDDLPLFVMQCCPKEFQLQ
jgi:hypothetical protein